MAIAMHCNLRQLTPRQSSSALNTTPMTSLKSLSLSVAVLERFYCSADTLRYTVTLTFDPVTFTFCSRPTSDVMFSNSIPNLSEVEQSAAELLTIWHIFAVKFKGWGTFSGRFSGVRGSNFTKLGENTGRSSTLNKFCLRVEISCCISKHGRLNVECIKQEA